MSGAPKIAIIGGSKEANDLALVLGRTKQDFCLFVTSTYRAPSGLSCQEYTADTDWSVALDGFTAVVLTPHPFADVDITPEIPVVVLCRPAWKATSQDNWTFARDATEAAALLNQSGATRPMLAVGRERLEPFLALERPNLLVRHRHNPAPDLKPNSTALFQPGPFSIEQEVAFLKREKVDCIVAHNAGGQGGWPKLGAARELGMPVILINRPKLRWKDSVEDVWATLIWLRQHVGLDLSPLSD